jgi:hypothetical protein
MKNIIKILDLLEKLMWIYVVVAVITLTALVIHYKTAEMKPKGQNCPFKELILE